MRMSLALPLGCSVARLRLTLSSSDSSARLGASKILKPSSFLVINLVKLFGGFGLEKFCCKDFLFCWSASAQIVEGGYSSIENMTLSVSVSRLLYNRLLSAELNFS